MGTIPLLTVGDDPHERGLQHGRRFAREIAHNIETYLKRFAASGLDRDASFAESERWLAAMAAQNAAYAAEMSGIAQGSSQTEAAIALLNARYELAFTLFGQDAQRKEKKPIHEGKKEGKKEEQLSLSQDKAKEELLSVGPDGCTTFGLLPQVTADGHTWLGQNWDWLEGVHGRTLVLRVARKDRPSFVCLTEAGIVGGKMGVNECGIGLVENGLASSHDGRNPYQKPFHMRCREILDAERYEDAIRPVIDSKRTCSANFVVGHADGEIIDLETSPDHVSYLHPVDGIVTHSNHFVAPGHGESQMEKISPNTLYRADRIRRLLQSRDGITVERMRKAASDHFGAPNAICRHPDPRAPEAKRTMTTGAVLIDLDARVMHVANGPPCENDYVPFPVHDSQ